jgi:hypothetical protein
MEKIIISNSHRQLFLSYKEKAINDWIETKSALVEDFNGKWKIVYY